MNAPELSTPAKVAGFSAAVAAVFGLALAVGNAVGPVGEPAAAAGAHGTTHGTQDEGHDMETMTAEDVGVPGGLQVSQGGYTLELADDTTTAGRQEVAFTISDHHGEPLTSYDVQHEKRLHLIAVRRDLTGFQHVHPVLADDGVWRTDLTLTPGDWRVLADFAPAGADPLTLGADLAVAGDYRPAPAQEESRTAHVDGYTVTLDGDLTGGEDALLTLSVSKDGEPVTDLQPYLGAYGHLVALRAGDLAYLHVHPDGEPGDGATEPGPDVLFHAEVPSEGTYRLFLDFRHGGVVRTAEFTAVAR